MLSTSQDGGAHRVLRTICGSERRLRLLRVLYRHPLEALSLSALARAAGADAGNTLRTLREFVAAGFVEAIEATKGRGYRPRRDLALFDRLHALFGSLHDEPAAASSHARLDEHKRRIGELILERHTLAEVRAKSLENLKRWKARGAWNAAYAEWQGILEHGTDEHLVRAMTAHDEECDRLRQSMPYVGLLDRKLVRRLNEKVAA